MFHLLDQTSSLKEKVLGSPLGIAVGLGGTALIGTGILIATRRKKRAKKTVKRRRVVSRRRKRISHRAPRHKGHKRVTFTTKTGKRVRFLVRGPKRSPKHRRRSGHTARRFIKGSPEAKRFMAKLRRMKR